MTYTTDADERKLEAGLREAFRPLLQAIERPELRLHSIVVESGTVSALIELHGSDATWLLTLPVDAPGSATLTLVSH